MGFLIKADLTRCRAFSGTETTNTLIWGISSKTSSPKSFKIFSLERQLTPGLNLKSNSPLPLPTPPKVILNGKIEKAMVKAKTNTHAILECLVACKRAPLYCLLILNILHQDFDDILRLNKPFGIHEEHKYNTNQG